MILPTEALPSADLPPHPDTSLAAGFLVCELCRLTVIWGDCRCSFFGVFLGGFLLLSPCNTRSLFC